LSLPVDHRKEIADKATQWLTEEKQTFEQVSDPNALLNVIMKISNFNINVIVDNQRRDCLEIVSSIGLPAELLKAFKYLKPEQLTQFFFEVEMAMSINHFGYSFEPDSAHLERITLTKVIYYDGLTKEKFFDTLLMVAKALNILNLHFLRLRV
jgi:hypothetical protein